MGIAVTVQTGKYSPKDVKSRVVKTKTRSVQYFIVRRKLVCELEVFKPKNDLKLTGLML